MVGTGIVLSGFTAFFIVVHQDAISRAFEIIELIGFYRPEKNRDDDDDDDQRDGQE
jgi:ribosomal protein S16